MELRPNDTPDDCLKMTQQNYGIRFFGNEELSARALAENLFGGWPTSDLLTDVVGAVHRSEIFVGSLQNRFYVEHYEMKQLGLTGTCRISRDRKGELVLLQELSILRADKWNCREGTKIFQRQLDGCKQLGIRRIIMFGRKNRWEWGYYVLPRFGFDGPIPKETQSQLPKDLQQFSTFGKLFEIAEGRSWWKQNGKTIPWPISYRITEKD